MPSVRIGASYAGKVSAAGAYTFFRLVTEGIPGLVTCSVRLSSLGTACANSTLSYCGSDKAPPLGVYVQRGGVTLDPSASDVTLPPCDDASNRVDCLVYPLSSTSGACLCSGLSTLLKQGNSSIMQNYSCPWPCNQPFTSGVVLSHLCMQCVSTARVQACMLHISHMRVIPRPRSCMHACASCCIHGRAVACARLCDAWR